MDSAIAPGRRRVRVLFASPGRIGAGMALTVFSVAFIGPFFLPHPPNALLSTPFSPPSSEFLLGTDVLGRDVLSRVLDGGYQLIIIAAIATLLGYLFGGAIGLFAGFNRSMASPVLMRVVDVLLAFPPLLFLLVVAAGVGSSTVTIVCALALLHTPPVARIIYTATLQVSVRGYVEAAVARGQPVRSILIREILPNLSNTIAADAGPRFTVSIMLVAALNFLGLGLNPPNAAWASMISENRVGLTIVPWGVVVPAGLIAALTIGLNLFADAVARAQGTSVQQELLKR
jgi:ABC-type dipeptide/oligopeptide/nickel transport system permease subunit